MVAVVLVAACGRPKQGVDDEWLRAYQEDNEQALTFLASIEALGPPGAISHSVDPGESGVGMAVYSSADFDVAAGIDLDALGVQLREIEWTTCVVGERLFFERDRGRGSASIGDSPTGGLIAHVSLNAGRLHRGHPDPRQCDGR